METTEGILDDSLKDMRKHAESISSSTSRGKGILSHFALPVETMRVIYDSCHICCLHSTFLGQTSALSTPRRLSEEKASVKVTGVACFLLSLLCLLVDTHETNSCVSSHKPEFLCQPFHPLPSNYVGNNKLCLLCLHDLPQTFNLLQTWVLTPPVAASWSCLLPPSSLLSAQSLEKCVFLDFSFVRGKEAYSYSALFSKQILLTACNSPGALAGSCNIARGPVTHATGWEHWVLLQPEDLRRKEGEVAQQTDLLILDLGFVPPAFTLYLPKTWIVEEMPFSLTVYVLRVVLEAMQFPWSHFMAPN